MFDNYTRARALPASVAVALGRLVRSRAGRTSRTVLMALGLLLLSAPPAFAEDPQVCGGIPPSSELAVQGLTWSGTVSEIGPSGSIVFQIDHVYAQDWTFPPSPSLTEGQSVTLPNQTCNPIEGLHTGHRYLMSTEAIGTDGPSTASTAIWEITGDRLSLVHMYKSELRLAPALLDSKTLAAAVGFTAPGAELPPTDTVPSPRPGNSGGVDLVLLLIAASAAFAAACNRRLTPR